MIVFQQMCPHRFPNVKLVYKAGKSGYIRTKLEYDRSEDTIRTVSLPFAPAS